MFDNNWDHCTGPLAHHIEQLNALNIVNALEALVLLLTANTEAPRQFPNIRALLELHRTATVFLLHEPGHFRNEPVHVVNKVTGIAVFEPPSHDDVPKQIEDFFVELSHLWETGDALDVASYALWRINWIHPFKNGNGRTARAFAYACMCIHLGVNLPGAPTVIDQILFTKPEYERVIRHADASFAAAGKADLSEMKTYLNALLQVQVASFATPETPSPEAG